MMARLARMERLSSLERSVMMKSQARLTRLA